MPKLSYKTRGNSNPRGKSRVYFCCHPEDFEKYFDSVYEEIMRNQNCAFYYDSEPEGEINEEWLSFLGEMQLFVIPVTAKFLLADNKGLNVEFPFSQDKHIPVLPLMQENISVDVFTKKMGSLQYLSKFEADETGISYSEKLDKYLRSVLIGDELAQKIRDAFDAYIFLSYRKKDRVYAQQLMRLIHKNEFCRDIAIWYDEFLTPGENFNSSIEAALKKSQLFALAVTPNLVNEENYVMNVEYPMAKDVGKKILPAEIVQTERDELEKKYNGIPACADAHDEIAFSEALLEALNEIAVRENDGDPRHNFFIGLAYLSGIDVEVNHERALILITSAAEAGLAEAAERLVSMYQKGEGVDRNYETALKWQIKLVAIRRAAWEKDQSKDNAINLCNAQWGLGDCYKKANRMQEALDAYEEIINVSREAFDIFKFRILLEYYGIGCALTGDILAEAGMLGEAESVYNEYLEISEAVLSESGDTELKRNLAVSYQRLGDIYKKRGKIGKAKQLYLKAFEKSRDVRETFDNAETRRDISVICDKLGDIYLEEKNYSNSESLYLWALKISKLVFDEVKTNASKKDIAICYTKLARLFKAEGNNDKAKEFYQKERTLREELFVESDDTEYKIDLYDLYYQIADLSESMGQSSEAEELFFKAIRLAESFSDQWPDDFKYIVSSGYNRLGHLFKLNGRIYKAREMYKKSLGICEAVFNKTRKVNDYDELALACCRVATVEEGETQKYYLQHACDIWDRLIQMYPDNAEYKRRMAIAKKSLSNIQ